MDLGRDKQGCEAHYSNEEQRASMLPGAGEPPARSRWQSRRCRLLTGVSAVEKLYTNSLQPTRRFSFPQLSVKLLQLTTLLLQITGQFLTDLLFAYFLLKVWSVNANIVQVTQNICFCIWSLIFI